MHCPFLSYSLRFRAAVLVAVAGLLVWSSPARALSIPLEYRGGVTVTHVDTMPPMSFFGLNGEPKGFVIDLWRKWSSETGVPVRFVLTDWANSLELVRSGEVDIHGGLFLTPNRLEYLDYTDGLFSIDTMLFTIKGRDINGMDDLGDRVVGVLKRGAAEELMQNQYPEVARKSFVDVQGLGIGEVDAVVTDYPNLMFIGGSMGVVDTIVSVQRLEEERLRAGVAKGNEGLLELVRSGLQRIDDEERENILHRWFVRDAKTSETLKIVVALSLTGLIGAVCLLVFGGRLRGLRLFRK